LLAVLLTAQIPLLALWVDPNWAVVQRGLRRPSEQLGGGTQLTFVKPPEPERPDRDYELEEDDAGDDADAETVTHEGQRGFRDDTKD
jgi:hypothetical protein